MLVHNGGTMTAEISRAHERKRVLWEVMVNQNGRMWKCTAFDISPGGVKIRIAQPLAINSRVVIAIDRAGNFPGEVRWQDKGLAGDPIPGRRCRGGRAAATHFSDRGDVSHGEIYSSDAYCESYAGGRIQAEALEGMTCWFCDRDRLSPSLDIA